MITQNQRKNNKTSTTTYKQINTNTTKKQSIHDYKEEQRDKKRTHNRAENDNIAMPVDTI